MKHVSSVEPIANAQGLADLVRPFVGARLRQNMKLKPGCPYGTYLPRTAALDIEWSGCRSIDVDVREVTDEGVLRVWDCQSELIPWASIHSITLVALDEKGNRMGARRVEHDRNPIRRAA